MALILFSSAITIDEPKIELELIDARVRESGAIILSGSGSFSIEAKLRNASNRPIKIWDPKNTEGSMCLSAMAIDSKNHKTKLESLPIPRAAGVPTSILIGSHQTVPLVANLRWALDKAKLSPGTYRIMLCYGNKMKDSGPVKGVWTGHIESAAVQVNFAK